MIPLRDTIRSYRFPVINILLIVINTLIFLFEVSLSPLALERFIMNYGLVPANLHLTEPARLLAQPFALLPILTHMFLHGGWVHFLSNMWILYIFGDNVEDRMGSGRYLVFYLLSGLASGILQAVVDPSSSVPAIGASGAIAGVLGAYFVLFPGARVVTLIPIFLFPWFIEIPAIFYLGFWFVSQLFSGIAVLGQASGGGVAWWAHIGGFVFGALLNRMFTPRVHPAYYQRFPSYPEERDR